MPIGIRFAARELVAKRIERRPTALQRFLERRKRFGDIDEDRFVVAR